jgi:hypothetical protein
MHYTPAACLQRCSYSMYSQPSQLQGRLSQSMTLLKYSRSQAVSYHANAGLVSFSPKKNIASPGLQNETWFAFLDRGPGRGLSVRDHILNVKLDTTSRHKFSSVSWNSTSSAQKIALRLSSAISGMANAEGPADSHTSELSTSYAHGKKVHTEYSVTGEGMEHFVSPVLILYARGQCISGHLDTYDCFNVIHRYSWRREMLVPFSGSRCMH